MTSIARALLVAFSMLTRLPVHPRGSVTTAELRWSVVFYPWVGLALGGLALVAASGLRDETNVAIGGVLIIALLAGLTGGLHLDGVADWFDAVGGGRGDRVRMLAIMKDPHVGAHGTTALVLLLLAKWQAFTVVLGSGDVVALSAIPMLSRAAIVPLVAWMGPAREQGLAHSVHGRHGTAIVLISVLPILAVLGLFDAWYLSRAWLAASLAAAAMGAWAQWRLGGATGDVYGAALEVGEVTAATVLALHATA